jgi:hypothetical protein
MQVSVYANIAHETQSLKTQALLLDCHVFSALSITLSLKPAL